MVTGPMTTEMVEMLLRMGGLQERGRILDNVTELIATKGPYITPEDVLKAIGEDDE